MFVVTFVRSERWGGSELIYCIHQTTICSFHESFHKDQRVESSFDIIPFMVLCKDYARIPHPKCQMIICSILITVVWL